MAAIGDACAISAGWRTAASISLVVGAGIYGAMAAWDAALRGLSVALIDRGDFGGGTSFNNLKTLHGGLRSLQALNLRQMRLFIRERRALARMAPHLVRPLPFVVPTYRQLTRNRARCMRTALRDQRRWSSRDRNAGLVRPRAAPAAWRVSCRATSACDSTRSSIPRRHRRRRLVRLPDAQHRSHDAVVRAVGGGRPAPSPPTTCARERSAPRRRTRRRRRGGAISLTGEAFDVRAHAVVNAAGPWAGGLLTQVARGAGAAGAAACRGP